MAVWFALQPLLVAAPSPPSATSSLLIRFIDSATGQAVQPDVVTTKPQDARRAELAVRAARSVQPGRAQLALAPGRHNITISSPGYQPMTGEFEMSVNNPYRLDFHLDPISEPREVQPDYLASLHRAEETVFVGFVVDDESGAPLESVLIRTEPSGRETRTDSRGCFQIYVPVQTLAEATRSPATLVLEKTGYQVEERRYLELWSEGDWIYRIRLEPGVGRKVVDERQLRRRSHYPLHVKGEEQSAVKIRESAEVPSIPSQAAGKVSAQGGSPPAVRIPTNIRVLQQNGTTIDYVSLQTYCQRSLPSEWIASWGNTGPGGSGTNSLLAGAVAVRTYAIGFVNNPSSATYDICGTTSCQVYNPTAGNSLTTAAVNHTANYVMNQPGAGRIGFKITEYSAENNALDSGGVPISPCGDGFTGNTTGTCIFDPVCTGESRFGHGRGLCQWGTARWASGRRMQNRTTSDSVTNGYPLQNWVWLCEHYYPTLELVQGAPLMIGDYVRVLGTSSLTVRQCADGGISGGTNCPQITTKASGATGVVIGGPVRITTDGIGYTWWRVQWHDAGPTIGWSPENWLERTTEPVNVPPVLAPVPDLVVNELEPLSFISSATAPPTTDILLTDFESFADGTANGTVLFRFPTFSGSTDEFLEASPNLTTVTGTIPAGNASARALRANWSWNTTANPWLRLTTASAANLPNPVIDLTRKLLFDIYTDRDLRVAIGARETGNPVGTSIGSNGGITGGIEFVGVTNVVNGQPQATRTVAAGQWTTLVFDLPNEPVRSFASGNGVLSSATGLGVLEHLAFVPASGTGAYNVYLDNFVVSTPKVLTYSLSNAPAGMTINPSTGVVFWTPAENQGPAKYSVTVRVTDNSQPPLSDSKSFQVTVNEVNLPPVLAAISNRTVHAGTLVTFTNVATDPDLPANNLNFSLEAGAPPGASVETSNGVFAWQTSDVHAGTSNYLTMRVTDNGTPPLHDAKSLAILVLPRPSIQSFTVSGPDLVFIWSAIPNTKYRVQFKNNLNDPNWINLAPEVTATGPTASFRDLLGPAQRFYRVQVLTP